MDLGRLLMAALGVVILVVATVDALRTTIAPAAGAGPLAKFVSVGLWKASLAAAPGPRGRLLSTVGTLSLLVTIGTWVLLLWVGWTLVFAADADGIVRSSGASADGWDIVYFTGFTLFTLGVGDLFPATPLWQVLTPAVSLHGLFFVTLSITYLLPVMSAAVERRQQAASIWAMGGSPVSIVTSGWHRGSFQSLERDLQLLAPQLMTTAERHPTYPVLNYFHTGHTRTDFRLRVAALDDAATLLSHAVQPHVRPSPGTLQALQRVVDVLMNSTGHLHDDREEAPPVPDLAGLEQAGIPLVPRREIERAFASVAQRRQRLRGSVTEVGWDWDAVQSGPSA